MVLKVSNQREKVVIEYFLGLFFPDIGVQKYHRDPRISSH